MSMVETELSSPAALRASLTVSPSVSAARRNGPGLGGGLRAKINLAGLPGVIDGATSETIAWRIDPSFGQVASTSTWAGRGLPSSMGQSFPTG